MRCFATVSFQLLALSVALAMFACTGIPDEEPALGPNHQMSWEQFRAQVYQESDTGIFIVNGDEAVETEQGLHDFYDQKLAQGRDAPLPKSSIRVSRQELIVNRTSGNMDDMWTSTAAPNLTYCINAGSFGSNYSVVGNAMYSAATSWEVTGARIDFIHSSSYDSSCSSATTEVVFNVRLVTGQPYLARAFFPSYARSSREILIDSTAFGTIAPFTLTGILRHELGHALGFRHEHTRPEAGICFEDTNWRALTSYDPSSVMHYPACNGANTGDLNITQLDRSGAVLLYPPNPIDEPGFFIRQLYPDVLVREPDQGGLTYWTNWLQACNWDQSCLSERRTYIAHLFFDSQENRNQNPELTPGLPNYNAAFVTHCYTNFLRRPPDPGGYSSWLNYLNSSGDYRGLIHAFINSAEYRLRFGPQ